MFHKLAILACTLAVTVAQYHQPQYQQAQYQQQPQYQQAQYQQQQPQYQQAQYQQQQPQYQQQAEPVPTPAQYPAGVDAHSCPNYPDCSNPLLTVQAVAKASDPRYLVQNAPKAPPRPESQYSPDVQQKLDRGEYIGDGDYHGEGLDEALAPEVAVGRYSAQSEASQYSPQPTAGTVHYSAQQAASQYSPQPGAVQYSAQQAASQYNTQPAAAVQYPAQRAASQYSAQPGAVQYSAQQAASQYVQSPQYITAGQNPQHYFQPRGSQYTQATLSRPQYVQAAPVHESRNAYSPVPNAIASGSEPVPAIQLPAGVDANACPNYPFCS